MNKQPTLQGILSQFVGNYAQQHNISPARYKVIRHLTACRTPALGGQFVHCDSCDFQQHRYHSCRNRHCPKCQQKATRQWCEEQQKKLLPVPYYHLVFTLPHELNPWVQCHDDDDDDVVYQCLFAAAWHTLKTFAADKKCLNGELGMTAILHTWGQNLSRHVHLHCLVPGGALLIGQQSTDLDSADQQPPVQPEWHPAKSNYLFPVRALSRHFRGKMVSALRYAWKQKELPHLNPADVNQTLNTVMAKDWVVYSKNYLKQPDTIVNYLGRYTRKIAISESRIRTVNEQYVTFDYKDYKVNCEAREGALGYRDNKDKQMQLGGTEFLRRFLLHVLPQGFMRIRHYGFLSNRSRKQKLAIIRQCLQAPPREPDKTTTETKQNTGIPPATCLCPKCQKGQLRVCYEIPATPLYGR